MAKNPRLRKVPVALSTGTNKAGAWLGSIRVSGFTILIMSLTVLGLGILAPQVKILVEQRQQIADLQSQADQQKADISDIEKQRARWDDPAYVRAQARDRLYYVMPGEISYLIINDVEVEETAREKASATLRATNTDWVAGLLSSFLVSGLGTPTPAQLQPTPTPVPTEG